LKHEVKFFILASSKNNWDRKMERKKQTFININKMTEQNAIFHCCGGNSDSEE